MPVNLPLGTHEELMKELKFQSALLTEINAKLGKMAPPDEDYIPQEPFKPSTIEKLKKKGR